ncbi:hypothetical protein CMQ_6477 [Grosmannia clavigera kw1407]|uniref:Uncharacterized protein n=1 Tax=Grosmannia clavigera (strain kw1407 / UAMH 11150) TaxID=655863 RepID=F0XLD3_GROCL|nr:uncharacterized protein CMQ_6477 [Grosmannia clavigera kw1407]EFX01535.1 hypothetical protein CMQ_6477 [Grosmannia clavigera kw1407]
MSIPGSSVPALISAFTFGIVVNAASAALFLHASSHGNSIFRDGQRLVLAVFFLSAALWAQTDFISIAINTTATGSCQVGVIISTFFDQLGRFSIEQYLLWTINNGAKAGVQQMISQVLVAIRFVLGAVFIGLSRPYFDPVCVPTTSVFAVGIIVVALDAFIVVLLAIRAINSNSATEVRAGQSSSGRSNAVLLVIATFAVWTAMSALMLLGMQTTALLLRTLLPSIGLFFLVVIVAACNAQLTTELIRAPRSPESPGVREANTSRSITTGDSSDYPPSQFEDFKRNEILSVAAFERPREVPRPDAPQNAHARADIRRPTLSYQQAASLASGRIVISKPILQANGEQNPLNKIPTMSLEDAARSERERRADDLRRESVLVAHRPAPHPPTLTPEEGILRAISLKRKTVASVTSEPMFETPTPPSGLMPAAVTTSALLSPGVEEVRRRSPRQSPTAVQNIRPSRQLPESFGPSKSTSSSESEKTPLQKRQTFGLPGNPRAKTMKAPAKEADAQGPQTVLFMNKIEYDNPDTVESVIKGANLKIYDSRASMSVVHRPRPIPRNVDDVRNIFPSNSTPHMAGHYRSKSAGAVVVQKSLRYTDESPPQLPPMPLLPLGFGAYKGGQETNRPLPNNTKSMTFDEKMTLLFPTPPSAGGLPRRRSSLPEIPQIPYDFMSITMSPMAESSRMSGTTTRTRRTSGRTDNILEVVELPPMDALHIRERRRRLSDEAGDSWLPGIDTGNIVLAMQRALELGENSSKRRTNMTNERRASSPVLPQIRDSAFTTSSDGRSHDDFTTNWGSLHSSVVAVPIQANRQVARSTYVQGDRRDVAMKMPHAPSVPGDSPPLTDEEENADAELVEIKLEEPQMPRWHHRIGDDCPTFTDRKEKIWSRKMVPPTPLMLGVPSTRRPIIVKAAEPSPLESPDHVLAEIQAQLKRFEGTTMPVNESPSQRFALLEDLEKEMDMQAGHWRTMQQDMGRNSMSSMRTSNAAESRRQSMNSIGDLMASTPGKVISADYRASRRSRIQSAILAVPPPITEERTSPAATATEVSGANAWQRRLTGAQAELPSSSTRLSGSRRSKNFLDLSELGSPTPPDSDDSDVEIERYQPASIDDTIAAVAEAARKIAAARQLLWTPMVARASTTLVATLWTPPLSRSDVSAALFAQSVSGLEQAPHSSSRRREISKNADADPLLIETCALWSEQSAATETKEASTGLWAAKSLTPTPAADATPETEQDAAQLELELDLMYIQSQNQSKPQRPLTQRPPRRSRRMTVLPDIVENPEPLPNKRDTLGIFQFPWGEKSDMATFQPPTLMSTFRPPTFMAMPGTMSSGGPAISAALEARARELEEEEYSTSFFDDYDEEDELDKEVQDLDDDSDYSDSDDGFDESTLWEIASLLKTQQVPSKFSLLPPPLPPMESHEADVKGEDSEDSEERKETDFFEGTDVADVSGDVQDLSLWRRSAAERAASAKQEMGISQPDEATWKSYDSNSQAATARAKPRLSEPAKIETEQLWEVPAVTTVAVMQIPSFLWTATPKAPTTNKLWAPLPSKGLKTAGKAMLFDLEAFKTRSTTIRTTDEEPAALYIPRAPRTPIHDALETLTSNHLWTSPKKATTTALLWAPVAKPVVTAAKNLLFDLDVATIQKLQSTVTRSTDKEPATLNAPRLPRTTRHASLEKLTSSSLWTTPNRRVAMLWTPMPKVVVKAERHLFDLDVERALKMRASVRTTDKEPAALHMSRKPRAAIQTPLDQLVSDSLWTVPRHDRIAKTLWAPKPQMTTKTKGLLFDREAAMAEKHRAHTRTTDEEPAALNMPRKARKTSRAPLEKLASSRLWQSAVVTKSLWVPRPAAVVQMKGHLFDLAAAVAEKSRAHTRTMDKEPAALLMARKARKASHAPLETLQSSSLWQLAPKILAGKLLWVPKAAVVVKAQGHLFSLAAAVAEKSRAHTRTTDEEPAALQMPRKARKVSQAPLEMLVSSSLWQVAPKNTKVQTLWVPKPTAVAMTTSQLFDLAAAIAEKSRAYTRTTDEEPAALRMTRKARKASPAPLEVLVSSSLWQPAPKSPVGKRLWAPKPTVVVKTAGPLFDLEAVMAKKQHADTRTTAMESVAAQVVRMPRSLAQLPVLPLTSTSLWNVDASSTQSKEANWIMAKVPTSIRKTALVTPSEDWDAALQEALAASYPQSWAAEYDDSIMARIEALEHEREYAAMAVQQQLVSPVYLDAVQAEEEEPEQLSEADVRYYAYIQAMEMEAMMRLQALEGAGVQLQ